MTEMITFHLFTTQSWTNTSSLGITACRQGIMSTSNKCMLYLFRAFFRSHKDGILVTNFITQRDLEFMPTKENYRVNFCLALATFLIAEFATRVIEVAFGRYSPAGFQTLLVCNQMTSICRVTSKGASMTTFEATGTRPCTST
jgi:hypothetical protein